jgi:hypothetical protein
MSMRIGDIDVANEIIDLHYQLRRTTLILDKLLAANPGISLGYFEVSQIDNQALQYVQQKFPSMGITKKF